MIEKPMDVLSMFPVRKTKKQKQAFRDAVQSYATTLGYDLTVEKGSGAHNIVIGDSTNAKYLVTAHYDTPAAMPFPILLHRAICLYIYFTSSCWLPHSFWYPAVRQFWLVQ